RELELREHERSSWSSPVVLAILTAALAGFSGAGIALINGWLQRGSDTRKTLDSLRIEENRSEAGRILEMIKTAEPGNAAGNLQFLIDTGLISSRERVASIQTYLDKRQPGTGPFLPAADARYVFEPSGGLTGDIATMVKRGLNDFIAYLDRLGLRGDADRV